MKTKIREFTLVRPADSAESFGRRMVKLLLKEGDLMSDMLDDTPEQNPLDNHPIIEPVMLKADSTLKFNCHQDVSCFNTCCHGIDMILTPYDIIRLKNRLGLDSDDFLVQYTYPDYIEKSDLPVAKLKLLVEDGACPFLTPDGCGVYTDRPATCRYYPVGRAFLKAGQEDFFFLVKEPHCQGFQEEKEWAVSAWQEDQGTAEYDRINRGWVDMILYKKILGPASQLHPEAQKMFFMAATNMERFKAFITTTRFLKLYEVDPQKVAEIENDEVARLQFAFDWLKSVLFGEDHVRLREGAAAIQRPARSKATDEEDSEDEG